MGIPILLRLHHYIKMAPCSLHLWCLLEWSLGGHCMLLVWLIPREHQKDDWKKTLYARHLISNSIIIRHANSIQVLNLHIPSVDFGLCASNDILGVNKHLGVGAWALFHRGEVKFNLLRPGDTCIYQWTGSSLIQLWLVACGPFY